MAFAFVCVCVWPVPYSHACPLQVLIDAQRKPYTAYTQARSRSRDTAAPPPSGVRSIPFNRSYVITISDSQSTIPGIEVSHTGGPPLRIQGL